MQKNLRKQIQVSTYLANEEEKNKLEELASENYVDLSKFIRAVLLLVIQGEINIPTKKILELSRFKKLKK
jgi:hypothetical protein